MSQALYRKYRSKSLAEVVGQQHITDILSRAIASDRIAHAYLLTGPRGVGKTSVARILAHEINGLPYTDESSHLDIIEIDAASNNGVDDVRDLREKAQLAPVSAKKKVYIIDEVHMLSKPAFNALLKTLEEPPEHIVFILATTDVEKLPATIVSRTQRYGFRAIAPGDAVTHLRFIADKEGIIIEDGALQLIAERADGSFRDSISLLDQLASLTDKKEPITASLVQAALGLAPLTVVESLLDAAASGDTPALITTLDTVSADGISPTVLSDQLLHALRRRIAETPSLLPLLDRIIDVNKSSHPELKLLSALAGFSAQTQDNEDNHTKKREASKNVALSAPVKEFSASIEELSRQATKKRPAMKPAPSTPFDWSSLVAYVKEHHVALHSVLSKCGHLVEDSQLTLYTSNAFYKKKLDDPKYSAHLYESMQATGSYQLSVHTIPTPPPLKDSQAASVADIMGGGVEVSVDTSSLVNG